MDLTNYSLLETVQGMVAGGVGEGDGYGGYREPAGGDAPAEGHSRPRACCAPCGRCRGTCSCPRACGTGPTTTRRCRSAAARRSRSRGCRPATSSCCGLTGRERVLEVGTGSGYQTALLALLADVGVQRGADRRRWRRARAPALAGRRHPERDGAGGRRHARLAPVRAVRRDPGGGRVAGDPRAAGGAARARAGGWSSRWAIATTRSLTLVAARGRRGAHQHRRRRALRAAARRVRLSLSRRRLMESPHGSA